MTARPPRARGLIDAQTGEVLALTHQGAFRLHADGSISDVTPPFSWRCAAAGGGAVVIAGPDGLQWHGAGGAAGLAAKPPEAIFLVAVMGERVAAVGRGGRLTVWDRIRGPARSVGLDLEADGLAFDPAGRRVVVWGWDGAGEPAMAAVVLDGTRPSLFQPEAAWPAADIGVAMLADGIAAVGGVGGIVLVAGTGRRIAQRRLSGLERITGSDSAVGWFRRRRGDEIVVGLGLFDSALGNLAVLSELPIIAPDPFPEFAVVRGSVVVAAGVGARELAFQRLTADGWGGAVTVDLPDRPASRARADPVGE